MTPARRRWQAGLLATTLGLALAIPIRAWEPRRGEDRRLLLEQELAARYASLGEPARSALYDRLAESPFAFFRATPHLFYRDLQAGRLLAESPFAREDAVTWVHGDLHVESFGLFTDDRERVVYGLRGFGQSWVTSYLVDVWRLAVSLVLAAGSDEKLGTDLVAAFTDAYLESLESFRPGPAEKHLQVTRREAPGPLANRLREVERSRSRGQMLAEWTLLGAEEVRVFNPAGAPGLQTLEAEERRELEAAFAFYLERLASRHRGKTAYFQVLDMARWRRKDAPSPGFVVLIDGPTIERDDDRILAFERQGLPAIFPYLSAPDRLRVSDRFSAAEAGCRTAAAHKALVARADDHLGCAPLGDGSYSVRELSPFEATFDLGAVGDPRSRRRMARLWAEILAAAHARADADYDDELVPGALEEIVAELTAEGRGTGLREEVLRFAVGYARQVEADHAVFLELRRGD